MNVLKIFQRYSVRQPKAKSCDDFKQMPQQGKALQSQWHQKGLWKIKSAGFKLQTAPERVTLKEYSKTGTKFRN